MKSNYYGSVEKDYMEDFMDIVLKGFPLNPSDLDKVAATLEMMVFSKKVVIVEKISYLIKENPITNQDFYNYMLNQIVNFQMILLMHYFYLLKIISV